MSWTCPPKRIVVGVDFGEASARAVAVARSIAATFGSRMRAVHAERFEPPPYFTLEQIGRLEAERRAALHAARAHLAEFVGPSDVEMETTVLDEPPVDALVDASAAADLIVVGTHGRRGPGRWWLGSVAERVVRSVAVPVLVVRASASAEPQQLFSRITVLGDPGSVAAATSCAEQLARAASGAITAVRSAAECDVRSLSEASLVIAPVRSEHSFWRLSDEVATVLSTCERPVLFVPGH